MGLNPDIKKWIFIFLSFSIPASFLAGEVLAAENSDAIAVRVIPNAAHYSIDQWYDQQGYKGSPQKLIVDGYEAIRDGRTVLVNAANVENGKIYTNIYLISYNQEPDNKTLDILGQLVSHWKFNNNLVEKGECSISKMSCLSSSDCPDPYLCSSGNVDFKTGANPSNKGKCILKEAKACLVDTDCPANLFCDSVKAKVTRDVKRLGHLNKIKSSLDVFKANNFSYPSLSSGTYIPGSTISTWPSWSESFWPKLSGSSLLLDPVNSLGDCPGFESATCWKKSSSNDDFNFYRLGNDQRPILPLGSYAYIYSSKNNGTSYDLCAAFETKDLYDTDSNKLRSQACPGLDGYSVPVTNTAPVIKNVFLEGSSGQEFNGYVQAVDAENDTISWSLNAGNTIFDTWSSVPMLQDSGVLNQKRIYASRTGAPGTYQLTLRLADNRGAAASYPLSLLISNARPMIQADDVEYVIDPVNPLNYAFYIQAPNGITSYNIRIKNGSPDILSGVQGTKTEFSANRWGVNLSVLIPPSIKIPQNREIVYTITAFDKNNSSVSKDIKISLISEKPSLAFDCDTNARVNNAYPIAGAPCLIGGTKEGNHSISYSMNSFPSLELRASNGQVFLSGTTTLANTSGSPVIITATNEYGAISSKSFNIKVNTYCGDGAVQTPNSEGKGGLDNDGMERCDGGANVTNTVSYSPTVQYGCSTKVDSRTYPILDASHCVFEKPEEGGGYCGDGLCQFTVGGINIENTSNCEADCGKPTCGNGVVESSEQCDGASVTRTCHDINASYTSTANVTCTSACKWDTSNCLVCGPGYRVAGTTCVPCEAGYYKNGTNSNAQCLPCAIGTYSAAPGASSCTPCEIGSYNKSLASSSCQPCSPGTYGTGNNSCDICPADSFCAGGAENISCSSYFGTPLHSLPGSNSPKDCVPVNCTAGYYYNSTFRTCSQCPSGTFSQAGAGECDNCLPGTYLPTGVSGSSSCNQCLPNYYCLGGNNITHCDGSKISSAGSSSSDDCR